VTFRAKSGYFRPRQAHSSSPRLLGKIHQSQAFVEFSDTPLTLLGRQCSIGGTRDLARERGGEGIVKVTLFYSHDTKNRNVYQTPPGSGQMVVSIWYPKKAGAKIVNFIELDIPDTHIKPNQS
jgi:hypothetical protein